MTQSLLHLGPTSSRARPTVSARPHVFPRFEHCLPSYSVARPAVLGYHRACAFGSIDSLSRVLTFLRAFRCSQCGHTRRHHTSNPPVWHVRADILHGYSTDTLQSCVIGKSRDFGWQVYGGRFPFVRSALGLVIVSVGGTCSCVAPVWCSVASIMCTFTALCFNRSLDASSCIHL